MARYINIVISLIVVLFTCTSCFTMMVLASASGSPKLGSNRMKTEVKAFQRIAGPAALATTSNGDVICVIADFGEYYDGIKLEGTFYRKGTYSYVNTNGANRTVLVYIYGPDKKKLESYTEQFLKEKQKIIVDESPSKVIETAYWPAYPIE